MKHTVYILQEKQESVTTMKNLVEKHFDVVGESTDGRQAIEMIKTLSPDLLITEMICSGLDGLGVLKSLKESGSNTKVMVVSAVSGEDIVKKAINLGALYYMLKPIDPNVFAERVEEVLGFSAQKQANEYVGLDEKISKIFISVGIPPHIKGYAYLREGVKMAVRSPDVINNITKKLYPGIGEKFDTSASKVERAIRHAIEVAWNRGRIDSINSVFGVRAYVGSEKPTNGEFIALVADKMILEGA